MDLGAGGDAVTRVGSHDVEGLDSLVLGLVLELLRLSVGVSGSARICGDDG